MSPSGARLIRYLNPEMWTRPARSRSHTGPARGCLLLSQVRIRQRGASHASRARSNSEAYMRRLAGLPSTQEGPPEGRAGGSPLDRALASTSVSSHERAQAQRATRASSARVFGTLNEIIARSCGARGDAQRVRRPPSCRRLISCGRCATDAQRRPRGVHGAFCAPAARLPRPMPQTRAKAPGIGADARRSAAARPATRLHARRPQRGVSAARLAAAASPPPRAGRAGHASL